MEYAIEYLKALLIGINENACLLVWLKLIIRGLGNICSKQEIPYLALNIQTIFSKSTLKVYINFLISNSQFILSKNDWKQQASRAAWIIAHVTVYSRKT